ncbi:MAG: hypothetical protein VYB05_07185 [Pseudomonadota bacterium]|nr:hypothetical protein [Pseudomonadota bacterium]
MKAVPFARVWKLQGGPGIAGASLVSDFGGLEIEGSQDVVGEDGRAISVAFLFELLIGKRLSAIIRLIVQKECSTAHRLAFIISGAGIDLVARLVIEIMLDEALPGCDAAWLHEP